MNKEIKLMEIHDESTWIKAMAFTISGEDHPLIWKAGYGTYQEYIMLITLTNPEVNYNWSKWDSNTMKAAHRWLNEENWKEIKEHQHIHIINGEVDPLYKPKCINCHDVGCSLCLGICII